MKRLLQRIRTWLFEDRSNPETYDYTRLDEY